MKLTFTLVAAALVFPAVSSFAQEKPLTRADVRAQLYQLEKAGYWPGSNQGPKYPRNMQAAEAKVDAQMGQTGFGGVSNGTSETVGDHEAPNSGNGEIGARK
jgi:hypothetical protein